MADAARGDIVLTLRKTRARAGRLVARARLSPVARQVRDRHLTYLSEFKLRAIESCLNTAIREGVPGDFHEAGVALGGSGIVIARKLDAGRSFHGYDVFGMIPAPGDADPAEVHERYAVIASGASQGIDGETYYGYRDDLYAEVVAAFASFGVPVDGDRVQLHRGLFEDTLDPPGPVAFAHIDCDWHDPVRLCLERIHAKLSPGGWIVADDYYVYGGARTAIDAFLAEHSDLRVVPTRGHHNLLLRRM